MSAAVQPPAYWEQHLSVKVMDPDGWDRRNFKASWAEPLTEKEFKRRAALSTCVDAAAQIVRCSCGQELATNKHGWLWHHADGSHTFEPEGHESCAINGDS